MNYQKEQERSGSKFKVLGSRFKVGALPFAIAVRMFVVVEDATVANPELRT
jgi:hypothetical protein